MKFAARSLALVVAMSTVAHAQNAEAEAEAEALFQQGKKLMDQKAFAAACEKFEASERIEAAAGTELNLAKCRAQNGQLATAWAMFVKAAQTAKRSGNKKIEVEAERRTAELEPRLVYLTISVPRPVRVAGLVVHRNDTVVEAATYDQPVPVDPDEYRITAEAPGHERWQRTIAIVNTSKTIEVPQLEVARTPPGSWMTRRKAAVALGVLGLAAGGTGIAFGLKARNLERQSEPMCPFARCAEPAALALNHQANTDGRIANLGMFGGGALVVGAITLWIFSDPRPHGGISIAPSVGPSGIGLAGAY
jgi:hypothetical protein